MKAWVRTDTEYVILVFSDTRGKAKVAAQYFDDYNTFLDVRLRRVPELDDAFKEEVLVDHEWGPTWCSDCTHWDHHEYWHFKGHRGDHCKGGCVL